MAQKRLQRGTCQHGCPANASSKPRGSVGKKGGWRDTDTLVLPTHKIQVDGVPPSCGACCWEVRGGGWGLTLSCLGIPAQEWHRPPTHVRHPTPMHLHTRREKCSAAPRGISSSRGSDSSSISKSSRSPHLAGSTALPVRAAACMCARCALYMACWHAHTCMDTLARTHARSCMHACTHARMLALQVVAGRPSNC